MPREEIKYKTDDLTIVWKPNLCIHSTHCWKGLPGVFKPREKPWVDPKGAKAEKIKEQIDRCPSGALSYTGDAGASTTAGHKIEITPNGPIIVHGAVVIQHSDGSSEHTETTTALCRCGASSRKPYCDGTHTEIGFEG